MYFRRLFPCVRAAYDMYASVFRTRPRLRCTGCGKTSLINVIRNKVAGTRTGQLFINGHEDVSIRSFAAVGMVPQNDIMHPDVTVRECLQFCARYRRDVK